MRSKIHSSICLDLSRRSDSLSALQFFFMTNLLQFRLLLYLTVQLSFFFQFDDTIFNCFLGETNKFSILQHLEFNHRSHGHLSIEFLVNKSGMDAIGKYTHTLISNNSHHITADVNLIDPHSKFKIPDKIPILKIDVVR